MGLIGNIKDYLKNRRDTKELIEIEAMASKLTDVGYQLHDATPTELLGEYQDRKTRITDELIELEKNFRKKDSEIEKYNKDIKECKGKQAELKSKHPFLLGMPGAIISRIAPIALGIGASVALPFLPFLAGAPALLMMAAQIGVPILSSIGAISGVADFRKIGNLFKSQDILAYYSLERQIKDDKRAIPPLKAAKKEMLREIEEKGKKELAAENDFAIIKSAIKAKYEKNKNNIECLKYYKEYQEEMKAMASNAGIPEQLFANIERGKNNLLNGATEPFAGVTTKEFFAGLKQLRKNLMLYQTTSIDRNTLLERIADLRKTFESGVEEQTNASTRRRPEPRKTRERRERRQANPENVVNRDDDSEEHTNVDEEEIAKADEEIVEADEAEVEDDVKSPLIDADKIRASISDKDKGQRGKFYSAFKPDGLNNDAFTAVANKLRADGNFISNDDYTVFIGAIVSGEFVKYLSEKEIADIENNMESQPDRIKKLVLAMSDNLPEIVEKGDSIVYKKCAEEYFKQTESYPKGSLLDVYRQELNKLQKAKSKADAQATAQQNLGPVAGQVAEETNDDELTAA